MRNNQPNSTEAVSQARHARREQTLDYIAQLTGQLRDMADSERQSFLTFLLSMAYLEAHDAMRRNRAREYQEYLSAG